MPSFSHDKRRSGASPNAHLPINVAGEGNDLQLLRRGFQTSLLSNLARAFFTIGGVQYQSVEAFVQAIKYPEGSPTREAIYTTYGGEAKRSGKEANTAINATIGNNRLQRAEDIYQGIFVYFQGEEIPYRSQRHFSVIKDALRAKLQQNEHIKKVLIATGTRAFQHEATGEEGLSTSLPKAEFCKMLTELRSEFTTAAK